MMNTTIEATTEKRRWARAWDAAVDAHPVLAKDLLVTARTPMFVGSVLGTPILLGALVLLTRLGMGDHLGPTAGRLLFPLYFTGLAISLGVVGAGLGSTVVVQEREAGALEALKFSALGPRRIVLGKFAAVLLAEGALVVCTLPLLAFVLAMGGVSLAESFVAMAIALACGAMTASLGIATSAHVTNTRRSLLASLLGAGAVGIGVTTWLAFGSELGHRYGPFAVVQGYFEAPLDGANVALLFVIPAYALTTVLSLGRAAATSGLMDASEDRSRPIKRWVLGTYSMGAIVLFVCSRTAEPQSRGWIGGASMIAAGLLAGLLLFAFVGEPTGPSRRMQVQPRSVLARVLTPWCLAPSVLFAIVAGGAVLLSIPVLSGASATLELDALWAVAALSTLGGFMGWVAAGRGATRARRFGAFALAGFTLLFALLRDGSGGPGAVDAICPLWVDLDCLSSRGVLASSVLAWGVAALVSLGLMLRAVRARNASSMSAG
jgi:ABC-type transport system involved in cytochrome c biogenesis permease component